MTQILEADDLKLRSEMSDMSMMRVALQLLQSQSSAMMRRRRKKIQDTLYFPGSD
jgi:hypothetical protein